MCRTNEHGECSSEARVEIYISMITQWIEGLVAGPHVNIDPKNQIAHRPPPSAHTKKRTISHNAAQASQFIDEGVFADAGGVSPTRHIGRNFGFNLIS